MYYVRYNIWNKKFFGGNILPQKIDKAGEFVVK